MAITKVTGHVIDPITNITSHNINSSGIITATRFDGPIGAGLTDGNFSGIITATQLNVTGVGTFNGIGVTSLNVSGVGTFNGIGVTSLNVSGVSTFSGNIFGTGDVTITDTTADSAAGPEFKLYRNSASPADADYLGQIKFAGESDTGVERNYAKITGKILDASNGTEDGILEFAHIKAGSQTITGRWRSDSLQLLNGTSLTVAGTADVTGNMTVGGNLDVSGVLTYEDVTNIDSLGIVTARTGIKVLAGGINAVGVVTATSFAGDGSALTGITQTTINNNANNRIITGSGTANTLEGEANLTFDGTSLDFANVTAPGGSESRIYAHTEGGATTGTLVLSGKQDLRLNTGGFNRWILDGGDLVTHGTTYHNLGSSSTSGGRVGNVNVQTSVDLIDGAELRVGNSDDLKISHSSNQSIIQDTYGDLRICGDTIRFRNGGNTATSMQIQHNGAINLYYNTSAKLATSSTGVSVTGEVAATQDYPSARPVLDFNFAATKTLDPRFKFTRVGTGTFVNNKGIIKYATDNKPRFDHHPTSGVSLGLLLERQQTNHQEYSTLMSEANGKTNITVTDNFAISPDGTQNASKIVNSTSNNTGTTLSWNGATVANNSYGMWSVWVKSEETSCILQFYTNTYLGGAARMNIELADGTTGGDALSSTWRWNVEEYPNKWWRVSWGGNGANAGGSMLISVVDSKTAARGATCGSATNKTWFAWGIQEEISTESRIATSYIPTYGAAATRGGDRAVIDGDDFDDFFDRFQGTIVNEHSNALQCFGGGGSGWEMNNDQFQTNLINSTGSGYAASSYPGAFANVMGDRGAGCSGNGSGNGYIQVYGPNNAAAQNAPANTGNGRFPSGSVADYTRYYRTWTDAMSYDITSSTNIVRSATGGATASGTNTNNIVISCISKLEMGNDATDLSYSNFYGRIKRWTYFDKILPESQLATLTSQLPNSYL